MCLVEVSTDLIADNWLGLKLANLHSMAVDYVKTGLPAHLSRDLKPLKWPHFMEKVGKQQHQVYTSRKVLGQLYDQVERIDFVPTFAAPFDSRILQAYTLDEHILQSAREIKQEYDAHMRRIMAQQEINTEFEVWSTFVLQHSNTSNNFKYHEQIGEISMALKDQFRLICHERAGGKDYEHIGPFAAAMYEVTAREVTAAVEDCYRIQMVGGRPKPLRKMTPSTMPLMSFPWLFQDILGKIANNSRSEIVDTLAIRGQVCSKASVHSQGIEAPQPKRSRIGPGNLDSGDYLKTSKGTTRPGEVLELFGKSSEPCERKALTDVEYIPSSSISVDSSDSSKDTSVERGSSANDGLIENSSASSPELLARKPYEKCSHNVEAPLKDNPKSTSSLVSHLRGSVSPLHSPGRTEVAGPSEKVKTTALDEAMFKRVCVDDRALSVEPDYKIPEGSNLRLLNDLAKRLSARSDESRDLVLRSFHGERKSAPEDVSSQQSKNNGRDGVDKDADTEMMEGGGNRNASEEVGYSSDSDVESEEVVLYNDNKARLLDQLAMIAGDDCASETRERE